MLVKEILLKIGILSNDIREVKGVSFDSRCIKDGYIFIAYKGNTQDGNKYVNDAFNNGAICIISDSLSGENIYFYKDIEKIKSEICQYVYDNRGIKVIGITGTNGKTSTAHLTYQALNNMGYKSMYIGTLGIIDGDYKKIIDNTTPDIDILSKEINDAKKRGCKYVVMEVSSHALSMHRVDIINFDVIAFTNLSQDHLDYYNDMENYFLAKKILFDNACNECIGIVNNEDKYSERILENFKGKTIKYGKNSEFDYSVIESDLNGIKFRVNNDIIESKLIYTTNIYNLLLSYTILVSLGISSHNIVKALSNATTIDGRAEVLSRNKGYIILDYAHTPDAMERILKETNKIKKGNNIVIFGCGGNRDTTKRKIMGHIANEYADRIYLTNDNPRFEKQEDIINDILQGIDNKEKLIIELDRKKAIELAIGLMNESDVLLILGKGHEDYQIIGSSKTHLSDKEIVKKCIEE